MEITPNEVKLSQKIFLMQEQLQFAKRVYSEQFFPIFLSEGRCYTVKPQLSKRVTFNVPELLFYNVVVLYQAQCRLIYS